MCCAWRWRHCGCEAIGYRIHSKPTAYGIVDIAPALPQLNERSLAEVLRRESELIELATRVLDQVQKIRIATAQSDPEARKAQFETDYRQAVVRRLDEVELYGIDAAVKRHRLSVAYISLTVRQDNPTEQKPPESTISGCSTESSGPESADSEDTERVVPVEELLASADRIVVRGLAGSGKTTLLQWVAVRSATGDFPEQLAPWNNGVPFFVRLRQFASAPLPAPETFPRLIAPSIADKMPHGWVHEQLEKGRAIVLVDGVDEVSVRVHELARFVCSR